MIGAGRLLGLRAGGGGGRQRAADRARAGGRRRVLQRGRVGAARGAVPDLGRHVRLRPRAARRVVGLPRRLGVRRRQDRVVRRDGADVRRVRGSGLGVGPPRRRRCGGGRADRCEPARDHADRRARAHPRRGVDRRPRAWSSGRSLFSGNASSDGLRGPRSLEPGGVHGVLQSAGAAVLRVRRLRTDRDARRGGARSRSGRSRARSRSRSGSSSCSISSSERLRSRPRGPSGSRPARRRSRTAVDAVGAAWAQPVVRVGAAVASLGALLALIAGVGRTTLAMARNGDLPRRLAAVDARHSVPDHAELAVGRCRRRLVLATDLRGAIGFSSFGVLVYYAVANASAFTQSRGAPPLAARAERRRLRRMHRARRVAAGIVDHRRCERHRCRPHRTGRRPNEEET